MTEDVNPIDALRERMSKLQNRFQEAQQKALLGDTRQAVGDVEATANRVIDLARAVRGVGYAWESDLEPRCLDFRQRWICLKPDVMAAIDREVENLRYRLGQVEAQVNWIVQNPPAPEGPLNALEEAENAVGSLESATQNAESALRGMFGPFQSDLETLEKHLKEVQWMLDQAAQSKLNWLPQEAIVGVVKAKWQKGNKDEPNGLLFLSDQRVVFERKEQVATKKVLFVATQKEMVQQVLIDIPLVQLTSVQGMKKGFMGHEDHLEMKFAPGCGVPSAHFHIDGQESEVWQTMVSRAKSGGLEGLRVQPISEAEQARLRSAPTRCPSCSGSLSAPVLRGQTEIHCGYCGNVVRF